ncbi:hypothetical protein [Nocardioides ochotonae]|uniref:hypothetical protein n=1 Tax=Nocardioides ochotonae TaxID=2685869 RepID=UPI0014079207|nr:hypothetical protein [Nocardioides ochotonae]
MSSRPSPLAPRGPLPAAVYWRRRLVLLVVLVVVVAVAMQLLGGDGDPAEPKASAALSAAEATPEPAASAGPTSEPSQPVRVRKRKRPARPVEPVLAEPSGPCVGRDIAVTPEVGTAIAGPHNGADIVLSLRTLTAEACTWSVSPRTLSVKITSGNDDIWSSQQCPAAIPAQEVTVRRTVSTPVTLRWNARRSDEDCSPQGGWALPGFYHVTAAALAGEPADVQFELLLGPGGDASSRQRPAGRTAARREAGRRAAPAPDSEADDRS